MYGEVSADNTKERLYYARNYLKEGKPIIIHDEQRQGSADLALAAEYCTAQGINTMLTFGKGLVCVALGYDRAVKKGIKPLDTNYRGGGSPSFGMPLGIAGVTGVSAEDRANTILTLAQADSKLGDFYYPGPVHTLIEHKGGLRVCRGYPEVILSLLRFFVFLDCGVLCEMLNEAGGLVTPTEIGLMADQLGTVVLGVDEIISLEEQVLWID